MLYALSEESICPLMCGTLTYSKSTSISGIDIHPGTTLLITSKWSLFYPYQAPSSCLLCNTAHWVQVRPVFSFLVESTEQMQNVVPFFAVTQNLNNTLGHEFPELLSSTILYLVAVLEKSMEGIVVFFEPLIQSNIIA